MDETVKTAVPVRQKYVTSIVADLFSTRSWGMIVSPTAVFWNLTE